MENISFQSNYKLGTQQITVWRPANEAAGGYPVILCANGQGEVGTTNSAPGSIGAQLKAGLSLPISGYVIEVHKPQDGNGSFQPERFDDARQWVLANLPNADPGKIGATGLSLGGGGVLALMSKPYAKLFAWFAPVAGTGDVSDVVLFAGVKASQRPCRIYGSSVDNNPPTLSEFTHLEADETWHVDVEGILLKYGTFIDEHSDHGSTWTAAYNFNTSDFYAWAAKQSTATLPPVVVVTPPPVVTGPTIVKQLTIPGTPATPDRIVTYWSDNTMTVK